MVRVLPRANMSFIGDPKVGAAVQAIMSDIWEFVASRLQQGFVAVINYQTDIRSQIQDRLDAARANYGIHGVDYYMIDPMQPRRQLVEAFEQYSNHQKNTRPAAIHGHVSQTTTS